MTNYRQRLKKIYISPYTFFPQLFLILGIIGYLSVGLLQEENQQRSHLLNVQLFSKQIGYTLKEHKRVVQVLAENQMIIEALRGEIKADGLDIKLLLNTAKDVSNSDVVYIINADGTAIFSSDMQGASIIGYNYSFRPYFKNAMAGKTNIFPAVGVLSKIRGLHLSRPVYSQDGGKPVGVMALKLNITKIETLFKKKEEKIVIVSPDDIIFSSNQPDWLFHSTKDLTSQTLEHLKQTRQFGENTINTLAFNINKENILIAGEAYFSARIALPIKGWKIISCQKKSTFVPLPFLYKLIIGLSIGVTGGLATLIFFLLVNINHRKEANIMLRQAEENYSNLFKNAAMGIFQSMPEGRFINANPAMAQILGFPDAHSLVSSVHSIGDEIYASSDHRKKFYRLLQENQQVNGFETQFFRKDDNLIWVSLSGRIAYDVQHDRTFLEGFCTDISERKLAEQSLRQERDIFSRVMETSPMGIVMVSMDRKITFANSKAEKMLKLVQTGAKDPMYEKPSWHITNLDGSQIEKENLPDLKVIATGHPVWDERISLHWPDASSLLVSTNMGPVFNEDGEITDIVAVFQDISEKIKMEKEAVLRQEQLLLSDRMVAMGILTSGVAHEINNPNTFISANAQMLSDFWNEASIILDEYFQENGDFIIGGLSYTQFKNKLPTICSRILDGSRRITRIVKELRDYSRSEKPGTSGPIDVNQVIRSALVLLSNMIKKSTQNFVLDLGEELPQIHCTFQRLEQVIVNIVQNACQALAGDDRGIFISSLYDKSNEAVVIICRDEGIGIAPDNLKRVRDPFFTTKRESGGTGLGLSISSTIIRELHGTMDLDSEPGIGTKITLRFPAKDKKNKTVKMRSNK